MPKIPMIPMLKILVPYARANELPLDIRRFESISRVFNHFTKAVKSLN